jgi:hypothetical protein
MQVVQLPSVRCLVQSVCFLPNYSHAAICLKQSRGCNKRGRFHSDSGWTDDSKPSILSRGQTADWAGSSTIYLRSRRRIPLRDLETEDIHCRLYSLNAQCIVLSVEYRKTPEWTFPTAFHDVFDAVDWVLDPERAQEYNIDFTRVILGGVSSGGTMGIAAAIREIETVRLLVHLILSWLANNSRQLFPHTQMRRVRIS